MEGSNEGDEEEASYSSDEGGGLLRGTLNRDALARTLIDVQTVNELGLVRSEVRRLRAKVEALEREKEDMAEDFRSTTKILLNRIKELEGDASSRPQTAAVIERIEAPSRHRPPPLPQQHRAAATTTGSSAAATMMPSSGIGGGGCATSSVDVLRIDEGEEPKLADDAVGQEAETLSGGGAGAQNGGGESMCGNCRKHIPGGNILAHSVTCYRNNFRCPACDEVILLRDRESHVKQWTDPELLLQATMRRDTDTIQRMLGHSADVCNSRHPETYDTAMHAAARLGDAELVAFFTAHGVDIDGANKQGERPIHLAAAATEADRGAREVAPAVRLLVELGASLNNTDHQGESPLMLLCRRGAAGTAKYLVEMRADAEAGTKLGDTPLQIAQRHGHQETVLALCTAGASLRLGTPSRSEGRGGGGAVAGAAGGTTPASRVRSRERNTSSPLVEQTTPDVSAGKQSLNFEANVGYPSCPLEPRRSSSLRRR